tara:strand:- start:1533 stop:1979 length:447 start_codon:yes stop_codon:yes gene_type:complete
MQLGKSILVATVIALLYISPSNSQDKKPLSNWLEFCPNSQLCFERPRSLIPAEVLIIDSIAGQLENENFTLFYDLGLYSSTFDELTTASSEPVIIDGHRGKILIQKNKMALTIPNVAEKVGFAMLIEFKNVTQLELGRRIFKSVKFKL